MPMLPSGVFPMLPITAEKTAVFDKKSRTRESHRPPMNETTDIARGLVRLEARQSVAATLDRLQSLLEERGVLIFARIDFSGDAAKAGLTMRPEQQLIFGNPKAGTPLMLADATSALDLPLRVICWEDDGGKT